MGWGLHHRFTASRRLGRAGRPIAVLLALLLVANGCQAHDRSTSTATGPLVAYTVPKTTPWFRDGDVKFVLTQGQTPIKTWTKHVDASRFGGFGRPAFTADGRYAFTQYADEQAGRYPYDGGDIRAELAWMDVTTGHTHAATIAAQSRKGTQPPGRPGEPYALQGSTVVWQAPPPPNAPDGQVTLMQLDLSQPNPQPTILRTIQLPPRTPEQQAVPYRDQDFTGNLIGASHGRIVVAKKYDGDPQTQSDRTFLIDTDGKVRDLGHQPTSQWVSATFSPNGTRLAYETGKYAQAGTCGQHQVTVFDTTTGQPATDFPPAPFDATPRPYFYGNVNAAVWWTADGKLRAVAGADKCPANPSEITPDGGVWELSGTTWTQIRPAGTYRDYPTPSGAVVVMANSQTSTDKQQPNQTATGTGLFIQTSDGQLVHVADVKAADVAVTPARVSNEQH